MHLGVANNMHPLSWGGHKRKRSSKSFCKNVARESGGGGGGGANNMRPRSWGHKRKRSRIFLLTNSINWNALFFELSWSIQFCSNLNNPDPNLILSIDSLNFNSYQSILLNKYWPKKLRVSTSHENTVVTFVVNVSSNNTLDKIDAIMS